VNAKALPQLAGRPMVTDGGRYNASTRSHAELDQAADLDEGDIGLLAGRHRQLAGDLPALAIVGGCCGTDARHVEALWS
jgi:homocysteine S-methyltransferase